MSSFNGNLQRLHCSVAVLLVPSIKVCMCAQPAAPSSAPFTLEDLLNDDLLPPPRDRGGRDSFDFLAPDRDNYASCFDDREY